MRNILLLLAFCWLLTTPLYAQSVKPLLLPLTVDEGLSRGSVQRLYLDREGFLWIATSNGLNRFDATRNVLVRSDQQNITDLSFVQLFEDKQQRLWAASANVGLFLLDKNNGNITLELDLAAQEQLEMPLLNDALEESADQLLLAISDSVYRYHLSTGKLQRIFTMPQALDGEDNSRVRQLWLNEQQLLIATNKGLFQLDTASLNSNVVLLPDTTNPRPFIRHLYAYQQQLYIAAGSSLYQMPLAALKKADSAAIHLMLSDLVVMRMLAHQNRLLLASNKGLFEFDERHRQASLLWRFRDSSHQIGNDAIVDLVASSDGGLWLASREDGAFYWHPRSTSFSNIELSAHNQPVENNTAFGRGAFTLAEGINQQLWVANQQGLYQLNLQTGEQQLLPYPEGLPDNFAIQVRRIYPDADGKLWLRTGDGLSYFDPQQRSFLPPPLQQQSQQHLLQNNALGHWRADDGAFWFYSKEGYYHYQSKTGELTELAGIKELVPPRYAGRFLGLLPGQPDKMLLSAADQLWLYSRSEAKLKKIYQAADYQPGRDRFADKFSVDPQNILWVTFQGIGLLGFDLSSLTLKHHFHTENQLISNSVYSNELDEAGNLWFAGNYGLSRLDTKTLRLEHFSKKDGLASHAFVYGASTRLSNGDLAYGTSRGITVFDPRRLMEAPMPPEVVITSISALNQPIGNSLGDLSGQLFNFAHDALGIEVQFSALNFRDSGKISYKFWLDGEQKLIYPEQAVPAVVFPQLKPGHYRFSVVAISPMTGMQSAPAHISLTIGAAPWRSQTALTAYASVLLLLLLLWWQTRRKQRRLLANAHQKLLASEQRLKQALEAVDSGAWEWHAHKNSIYAQRIHQMLGYNEDLNPLTMQQHLSLIHPDDRDAYQQAWQRFISAPDKNFDHSYRMQHKSGRWLWFRDIGKVTELSAQNKIERVIGTYSNITETRATKEKARLFGEAFQQTRDWVVLLDLEQRVIAANQSFTDVFGNMDEYLNNPRTHDLGISLNRRRFYTRLLSGMTVNQHWQGEETVLCPDGTERPTLINVTAVGDDLQVEFFVLVFTDITAQKQAEEELRYLASYDILTGLPNRALLMDRIYHGIEAAKRERRSLALCFIDLDKFKQINDSLGHDIGDLLLKKVAKRLTDTLRESDSVARLGGDEFVVLLEGYKNDDNISHVARKMIKTIGEPMQLGAHTVSISPSIGIAVYPEDASDAKELLKHADVAMYHAKDSGRNNFQFFINEMNEKAYMQLAKETMLRSAYQQSEFINYYQPIYDSRSQKMVGVEVLMRWQSATGLVPPSEFIPLAEDLRLIVPMTLDLLERALADLQAWHQAGFPVYMSVNLSTHHLAQEDLSRQTALLLKKYQIPARCLRFEVTESALMQDQEIAIATMLALSEQGIVLALDDFGTGYSSLKYLKELPIDAIKIDRSFVKDIGIDSNDETIIDAMLSMANSLGMYCIAEGVETEQQLAFFTQRQCYFIQGYLFAKPMPAAELLTLLVQEHQLG
ncbi:EAL domain-containing protein [Rheinheimera sp.]|uniref:EAL domain-containing protein n=1 Tax=Rheinheimera sp. TaxID=1869214 RepID=UPI0027B883F5|nr:EAL domain-containing protein [Rheinheimera sp.]